RRTQPVARDDLRINGDRSELAVVIETQSRVRQDRRLQVRMREVPVAPGLIRHEIGALARHVEGAAQQMQRLDPGRGADMPRGDDVVRMPQLRIERPEARLIALAAHTPGIVLPPSQSEYAACTP